MSDPGDPTTASADSATLWCPSCGTQYVAGSRYCSACRVALVAERPGGPSDAPEPLAGLPDGYAELGAWPRLATTIVTRRLEDAGVPVATSWSDPDSDGRSVVAVPVDQLEFADAVLRELPLDDELPRGSLKSYIERIETRLGEIAVLLDELRDLDELR